MPSFSTSVVLNDGQGTPVAHTFAPLTLIGQEATFVDRSGGIVVGYPKLAFNTSQPNKTSRIGKVRTRMWVPTLEVVTASTYNGITPAATKAYDLGFDGVFMIHERSILQERKNLKAYVKNLMAHQVITDLVETQETFY